ncbi:MAG: chromosomal replication initiator protein DnaA [Bacteroidetes bacterium]|nr:chromosomal replication initiator protein DnaA [Bacteroidota bacterium]
MSQNHEVVWASCLNFIKDNVNRQSYKTWFEPIKPISLDKQVLTIQVPSLFFYEWLEEHYVNLMKKAIKKELGNEAKLEYNIVVENSSGSKKPYTINMPGHPATNGHEQGVNIPMDISGSIKNPFVIPGLKKVSIDPQLNPNYVFDNLIEGECNRLARSAGLAVAKKPGGTSFNPLMIYGGVGLGKTHLVQAIGNSIKHDYKSKVVLYVQSEKFINQFIDSIKTNSVNDFINFYQLIDVLIVDDIQFLSGKERTQDIFFHIFNHLHQNGKQIILTSDRAPKDLTGIEERLLSRFKWGLSADLQAPDFETRVAILENKMYMDGIELPKEVREYIAYNISTNIRELEGALISLLAHSSINRAPIDLNISKEILKNFINNVSKELTIDHIQTLVCEHYEMPIDLLKSKTRKREIVQARQISMFLAKKFTKTSLANIGKYFGGRDHSTVIHACQTVTNLMDTDTLFKEQVEDLQKKITINYN